MKVTLRPYQIDAVGELRAAYAEGSHAPLLVLPTGGGKTVCFCYIAENATARGHRVLILVHRSELLDQASRSLAAMGVQHALIAPGYTLTRDAVQVASVQTLIRRIARVPAPDLIVIDEAHHATAGSWRKVVDHWPDARLLGVTATPIRLDSQGLGLEYGGVFDRMVLGPSIGELIEQGFLVRPAVYAPPSDVAQMTFHKRGGDFNKDEVQAAMDKPKIIGDAVEHYRRICDGTPALAFCAGLKHAEHVAEAFRACGYRAAMIDGGMSAGERREMLRDLARGALNVVTSSDLIGEGVDVPVVGAAILLRHTASTGLYLQQVGRALRPAAGKDRAIILDHVGNVHRHGLPDEDREWSLAGGGQARGKKKDDDEKHVKTRQCPNCYSVHVLASRCAYCGHEYEPARAMPTQVDGMLTEIDHTHALRIKEFRRREIAAAQSLDALHVIAKKYGHKPGWAWYQWNHRKKKQQSSTNKEIKIA